MASNHVPLKYATGLRALREHRQLHNVILKAGEVITDAIIAKCKNPEKFIVVVRPQPKLHLIVQNNIKIYEREDAKRLSRMSKNVDANIEILKEGQTCNDIYILLSGKVEILKDNHQIAVIEDSGTFIGEMAILTNKPRTATVRTITNCKFYTFQGNAILDQAKKQPIVLAKLCKSLAQKLSSINTEFTNLQNQTQDTIFNDKSNGNLQLPDTTAEVKSSSNQKSLPANSTLFMQNDTSLEMYILLKGSVSVIIDKTKVAEINTAGTLIGEMSGLLCQPRSATVITKEPSVFCVVDGGDLLKFGTQHPNILMKMCLNLAKRLNDTNEKFLNLKNMDY